MTAKQKKLKERLKRTEGEVISQQGQIDEMWGYLRNLETHIGRSEEDLPEISVMSRGQIGLFHEQCPKLEPHPPHDHSPVASRHCDGIDLTIVPAVTISRYPPIPSVDNVVTMFELISISLDTDYVGEWSDEQLLDAYGWAWQQHLIASDNVFPDSELISKPPWVTEATRKGPGVRLHASWCSMDTDHKGPCKAVAGAGFSATQLEDDCDADD